MALRAQAMQSRGLLSKTFIVFASLYIAAGLGIFLTAADNYMGKAKILPLPSTVAALAFLGSIITCVVFRDLLNGQPSMRVAFVIRSNLSVVFPFGLLALISLFLGLHPTAYWGDDWKWIFLQSYDYSVFICAMLVPIAVFFRKHFHSFATVGLLSLLGSIWYEVEYPGTFSTVPNRAAGFPTNSNWSAFAAVMICSMSLRYKGGASRIADIIVLGITGLGLYFTLSRSGFVNFMLLGAFYVGATLYENRGEIRSMITILCSAGALVLSLLIIIPLAANSSNLMAGSKAQNRLIAIFSGEVVDEGSAADRLQAAQETMDQINKSPLIGHGTGFNRRLRQTPHNLYLKLWVDSGMFGLMTYLSLLASGFWLFTSRRYRPGQGFILVVTVGSFFSHNVLEERTFLLLFGMASTLSLYQSAGRARRIKGYDDLLNLVPQAGLAPGLAPGVAPGLAPQVASASQEKYGDSPLSPPRSSVFA